MLQALKRDLTTTLAQHIHDVFGVEHEPVVQLPPRRELGDLAFPAPLHLARELRRKPRDIAADLVAGWALPPIAREVRVEGAGYLNVFLDRRAVAAALLEQPMFGDASPSAAGEKVIVEHTNINPNKAAHIGHLRNAVLGDTLAAALRRLGHTVEIQNYIDDTGVQVADVVVGFVDLRGMTVEQVAAVPEPFDYTCWDLYSKVGQWYEGEPERKALRRTTLHALEADDGPRAEMGRLVAARIVRRHVATMARLGIGYDVLTRESDILGLDFFTVAFDKLKASGAVRLEADGKNEGCWVMPLSQSEEFAGLEDPDKVIVRSDGTVTYVGKDIAYQLWKFGLLGRDFHYCPWDGGDARPADAKTIWQTTAEDDTANHPAFGAGDRVINVIDARQSYLQKVVRAGLEALGHHQEATRSVHFAYEMVSLSTGTARQLGYLDADADDDAGGSLEMSGRKGIGVKADDVLDQLEAKSREKIAERYADLEVDELDALARAIATAAIRFFMTKATTTRVIAFDLDDAVSFEGETGPYLQYSLVREHNIRRKLDGEGMTSAVDADAVRAADGALWSDDLWDMALTVAQIPEIVAKAGETLELSLIARHAYDLAGKFHGVYRQHRIFGEDDAGLRTVRLAANQIFRAGLTELAGLIGVPVVDKM